MKTRTESEIQSWLQSRLARSIGRNPADVGLKTPFADLGLDSVEAMSVATELEDWIERPLSPTMLWDFPSISALATHLVGAPEAQLAEEQYDLDKIPMFVEFQRRRAAIADAGLKNPYFRELHANGTPIVQSGGRSVLSFAAFNYLGNACDSAVVDAATRAAQAYGVSVSSSRIVGGQRAAHRELERGLADFLGFEDSLLFIGGHAANVSTIGALMGPRDMILYDQSAHDSMVQGARLSHARMQPFPHNDWQAAERILTARRREFEKVLIVVEGIYSAEGDACDLPRFVEIKRRHHAWLYLDEAHSFGTIGRTGRGVCEYWDVSPSQIDVWMGTISKSLGSLGGVIAGRQLMVDFLRYNSSGFVNSVGMPVAFAAAALAGLENLRKEPNRIRRLEELSRRFDRRARAAGLDLAEALPESPSKPVYTGDTTRCLAVANRLFERGIDVQPLVPPSVAADRCRLRFFITSLHTEEQIDRAVDWTAEELQRVRD